MDFSDISRLFYLVNSCLSEVAKSAPEGRAVCLQLPLKHITLCWLWANTLEMCVKNTQCAEASFQHPQPLGLCNEPSPCFIKVTEEFDDMSQQATVCLAYRVKTKYSGGGGKKSLYKCPDLQMLFTTCYCCSTGKYYVLFFPFYVLV